MSCKFGLQEHARFSLLLLTLSLVPHPMRHEQVLAEELLGKVVKFCICGAQTIRGRDAAHTGHLMHILSVEQSPHTSAMDIKRDYSATTSRTGERGRRKMRTTIVHDPAKQVWFFPFKNIMPGTTRT